jgi:hypothetical protein
VRKAGGRRGIRVIVCCDSGRGGVGNVKVPDSLPLE